MSMEDMEKEIENEMMNNAAVKIQASFRGFKTRKQIGSEYGVSRKGKSKENASSGIVDTSAPQPASTDPITCDESRVAEASSECALAERLSPDKEASGEVEDVLGAAIASGGGSSARPPLSCLRSRSYPGSHELEEAEPPVVIDFDEGEEDRLLNPEPEVNLELDPDYINRAATKIQANFRGYKVRKSFKRPPPGNSKILLNIDIRKLTGINPANITYLPCIMRKGKENSGSKSSAKNQKLAHPTQSAQEKSKALATSERLQDNNNEEQQSQQSGKARMLSKVFITMLLKPVEAEI